MRILRRAPRARAALWAVLVVLAAGPRAHGAAASVQASPSAEEVVRAVHLLGRATFGVRPEDLEEVLRLGRDAWLERQLNPERIDDSALERRLAALPAAVLDVPALMARFPPPERLRAEFGIDPAGGREALAELPPEVRRAYAARSPARLSAELATAKLWRAVYSERQLEEVMTDFWFNHFNVFFGKGPVRWLVADYERRAIRPHVFGRFEEMLVATAAHPAMLIYLDNWVSGRRGLNENYARELLELHTLGVDGGYTQRDVVEVARVFTGWTVAGLGRARRGEGSADVRFAFRPAWHERGRKVVLGEPVREGGVGEGRAVLRRLAVHPSTARHIATKLAQRFVADDPPPALVERLADVFLRTEGDLRAVTRALFTDEAFYDPAVRGAKVKTPFEFVASALRATGAALEGSRATLATLRALGHYPYAESAPTGYPATGDAWVSGGAVLRRMEYALALAEGRVDGVRFGDALRSAWPGPEAPVEEQVRALAGRVMPGTDAAELAAAVAAELVQEPARSEASPAGRRGPPALPDARAARALGLLLGSPAFQRH